MSPDPAIAAMIGSVIAERYRIDSLLGLGGMGAVFRAHHLLMKRDVAIKVLHPRLSRNPVVTQRFEREAQSVARLEHPNIVRVMEFGSTDDGLRYLVMQLLEGKELHHYMGAPLPPRQTLERGAQILAGLAHAHLHGVVHRDLKPENIFVTRDHAQQEVLKLVDFGVAKMIDRDEPRNSEERVRTLTRAGLIFGTPRYMSPEQATGARVDQRSDQYAFGVIMYEMLTGRPPLTHEDPICLIRMQVSVDPPPLPQHFPEPVRAFVHRLLAKQREHRFETTDEALAVIQQLIDYIPGDTPAGPPLSEQSQRNWIESTQSGRALLSSYSGIQAAQSRNDLLKPSRPPSWDETLSEQSLASGKVEASRRRWPVWLSMAAACTALGASLAIWEGTRGSDNDALDRIASAAPPTSLRLGPTKDNIAEIDRALLAKDYKTAQDRIDALREVYPNDPHLIWREAKTVAASSPSRRKKDALSLFGEAIDLDPQLLDDPVFYKDVYELLNERRLRREVAIEFALQHMGIAGHELLLGHINVPLDKNSNPLGYELRQKILSELRGHPESARLVEENLNRHRDLLQAERIDPPCTTFITALEGIEQHPDRYFLNPLHEITAPKGKTKGKDPAEAAECLRAEQKLNALRAKFEREYGSGGTALPEEPIVPVPEEAKTATGGGTTGQDDTPGAAARPGPPPADTTKTAPAAAEDIAKPTPPKRSRTPASEKRASRRRAQRAAKKGQ